MTKKKTAGKTARVHSVSADGNKTNTGRKARKPHKRSITITVDGEWYKTLDRIARAMNKVSWCDNDNTPETVFDGFVWPILDDLLGSSNELCGLISTGIATGENGFDAPEPTHSARISELRAAFAGLDQPLLPRSSRRKQTA